MGSSDKMYILKKYFNGEMSVEEGFNQAAIEMNEFLMSEEN